MKIPFCTETKKKLSQGAIEFLAVFVLLFTFFMILVDTALFFRGIYMVQTASDEALARLTSEHLCSSDLADTSEILSTVSDAYFGVNVNFSVSEADNIYTFSGGNFYYILYCRSGYVPDALELCYNYNGLLMFRNHQICSGFSANTNYF
ncbi:MAG: hypothetical protein LUE64_04605 [Candidatus Gastranaerophilales bacterium]|nr:hypothetical protein [Candidatus Gastranaerophilales bacterium]